MGDKTTIGWTLIIAGLVIAVVGLVVLLTPFMLGKLPGDVVIERKNFRFYFPITSCVLISVLLIFVAWILRIFR